MNEQLFDFISACPTPYQAVAQVSSMLENAGFTCLREQEAWKIVPGGKYYVTRNGSSLIAFRIPSADFTGFQIAAAHCDSPALKLRGNAASENGFVRLSTEIYGGMIRSTWLDRPLSAAGRVLVRTAAGIESRLVDFRSPILVIPNVAIHMNRKMNEGIEYNPAVDLVPVYAVVGSEFSFLQQVAEKAGCAEADILATELTVVNPERGMEWNGLISAPRLDDLQCVFSEVTAFLAARSSTAIPVCCVFDNEEVGSGTKQGAKSTFLPDVLLRVCESLGKTASDYRRAVANSFLASCDNAHGKHPAHPELSDKNCSVVLNGGVVIKYNANQKYTSDGVSTAVFRSVCEKAGVPCQTYVNRADIPGGSTLGNLLTSQVSLNAVDIGLAQLAMHSCWETAGAKDTEYMVRALTEYYGTAVQVQPDGSILLA